MSRFWFAIFRDPSTLYILRFFPWNSGIYWRLHSIPVNASHYVIWHLYPCLSIPISEPSPYPCRSQTDVRSIPMSENTNVGVIPMSKPFQCMSHTNVGAIQVSEPNPCPSIPMSEPYQCQSYTNVWAIPVSEPNRCPSIPMSESMLCTTTSCFHSFLDRANHTNQKDWYVFDSINRLPCALRF